MPSFDLDIINEKQVQELLDDVGDRAVEAKTVMQRIATVLANGLEHNVRTQGDYLGRGWPQLAQATIDRRAEDGVSGGILSRTGDLLDSLMGGKNHIKKATKTSAAAGTKDFRAVFHQAGTKHGIPARPMLGINRQDEAKIMDMLTRFIVKGT